MKKIYTIFIAVILLLIIILFLIFNKNIKSKYEFFETNIEISKTNNNYINVSNIYEFINAIENENIKIIEIEEDLDLGYNNVKNLNIDSKYVKNHNEPLIHPTLKTTGVSKLVLDNLDGLIIYSKTGKKLLHTNIVIQNSKNIKIDNIKMEELWEWDEETKAEYDRNDWDYITINNSENVQIKNCEFSKSYDGIIDVKKSKNITIEYCKVNEIDVKNNNFFNEQFEELDKNIDKYPMYSFLKNEIGLSTNDIKEIASTQFKLHLFGANGRGNENIIIHDNLYLNVKSRVPAARETTVYMYNIYASAPKYNYKQIIGREKLNKIKDSEYSKFVSFGTYGIESLENSYVYAENYILDGYASKYVYTNKFSPNNPGEIVEKNNIFTLLTLKQKLEKEAGNKYNNK